MQNPSKIEMYALVNVTGNPKFFPVSWLSQSDALALAQQPKSASNTPVSASHSTLSQSSPSIRIGEPPALVLIRGLPGAGKSTIAQHLPEYVHVEADHFFQKDGQYQFDPNRLQEAHDWCLATTRQALADGRSVVVANTFTKIWEIKPYLRLGVAVQVIEATGCWPNIHGVPDQVIEHMRRRWENLPTDLAKLFESSKRETLHRRSPAREYQLNRHS